VNGERSFKPQGLIGTLQLMAKDHSDVLEYTGFVLWECPGHFLPSPSGPHSTSELSLFNFVETAYGSFVFGGANAFQDEMEGAPTTNKLPFGVRGVTSFYQLFCFRGVSVVL
jgi:hypothetical protein